MFRLIFLLPACTLVTSVKDTGYDCETWAADACEITGNTCLEDNTTDWQEDCEQRLAEDCADQLVHEDIFLSACLDGYDHSVDITCQELVADDGAVIGGMAQLCPCAITGCLQ